MKNSLLLPVILLVPFMTVAIFGGQDSLPCKNYILQKFMSDVEQGYRNTLTIIREREYLRLRGAYQQELQRLSEARLQEMIRESQLHTKALLKTIKNANEAQDLARQQHGEECANEIWVRIMTQQEQGFKK